MIKQAIDQLVDHKLAVPALSAALMMDSSADLQRLTFQSARGRISMAAPAQAIVAVASDEINEHSITAFLQQHITPLLPDNVQKLIFTLRPEVSNSFYYHYSHGLKKHDGICQRIAHGQQFVAHHPIERRQHGLARW